MVKREGTITLSVMAVISLQRCCFEYALKERFPHTDTKPFHLCASDSLIDFSSLFLSFTVQFLSLQQMIGSKGQEHCRDCA